MNQKLLNKSQNYDVSKGLSDPLQQHQQSQKNLISLHQNYQNYKHLTKQFHQIVFYIFVSVQIVWIGLSLNITTLNHYNQFIDNFLLNFNQQYKRSYLDNHPGFKILLQDVNSFDSDYRIICWLIWISHVGFQLIFGYILFINRTLFKQYKNSFKDLLPIFFSLLTVFVVRDCLLMSVSSIVQMDLVEVQTFIENQHAEFLKYDGNFLTFIYTSLVKVQELINDCGILKLLTYTQQLCDLVIIFMLTVQIIRINRVITKCINIQKDIKQKKQFFIIPLVPLPPLGVSQRHPSQFSKISEQRQHSTAHVQFFANNTNLAQSHKQMGGYSHKEPLSFKQIPQSRFGHQNKQKDSFIKQVMKKSKSNKNLRKLNKSGSCNYLKQSVQPDQFEQMIEYSKINKGKQLKVKQEQKMHDQPHHAGVHHGFRLKKQISLDIPNIINGLSYKNQIKNAKQEQKLLKDNLIKGQSVVFEV